MEAPHLQSSFVLSKMAHCVETKCGVLFTYPADVTSLCVVSSEIKSEFNNYLVQ